MPTKTPKSELGAEKKQERAQAKAILATLRGQDIYKLSSKQRDDLFAALCLLLNITDKNHIIK